MQLFPIYLLCYILSRKLEGRKCKQISIWTLRFPLQKSCLIPTLGFRLSVCLSSLPLSLSISASKWMKCKKGFRQFGCPQNMKLSVNEWKCPKTEVELKIGIFTVLSSYFFIQTYWTFLFFYYLICRKSVSSLNYV